MSVRKLVEQPICFTLWKIQKTMKSLSGMLFLSFFVLLFSCEKEKPLYDQVMDIHDEVMPKMDALYKMKKDLQTRLEDTVNITGEQRAEMEVTITLLDSANTAMMVWMREFNPPDEKNKEEFQKYMESELVRVKKMREVVMSAMEKGKLQN
jgi:hypothetical protein